jgi:hypothetical protein
MAKRAPLSPIAVEEFLENLTLLGGKHSPDHAFCVMEAVAYVAGEPWSDHPKCADPVLTGYCIALNDRWDDARRQALKPYIPRLVGTAGSRELSIQRAWILADAAIRSFVPMALDCAGLTAEATKLRALGEVVPLTVGVARKAVQEARNAADAADAAYAAYAAYAADAAAAGAADAAYAAYAAYAADAAAAADADAAAAYAAGAATKRKRKAAPSSLYTVEQVDRSALDLLDRLIHLSVPVAG